MKECIPSVMLDGNPVNGPAYTMHFKWPPTANDPRRKEGGPAAQTFTRPGPLDRASDYKIAC